MSSASPGTVETRALYVAGAVAKVAPRPPLTAIAIAGVVALGATNPPRSAIHKPCGAWLTTLA